jgi:hypothetical protein
MMVKGGRDTRKDGALTAMDVGIKPFSGSYMTIVTWHYPREFTRAPGMTW